MIFLAIALGSSVPSFADQNLKASENQPLISQDYYVRPGEVFVAPNGIYVSVDGVLIQINTLRADEVGVYVPYEEIAGRLIKCPFCQRWYDPSMPHKCRGCPE